MNSENRAKRSLLFGVSVVALLVVGVNSANAAPTLNGVRQRVKVLEKKANNNIAVDNLQGTAINSVVEHLNINQQQVDGLAKDVLEIQNAGGVQGPKGDKGDPGNPGINGSNGTDGAPGSKGDKGDPGIDGLNGRDGAQGVIGPIGPQGPVGGTGAMGPQGPQGPQGQTGGTGATGQTGAQGPQGPQGQTGATGSFATSSCQAVYGVQQCFSNPNPAGGQGLNLGSVSCASGYKVVSGGVDWSSGCFGSFYDAAVIESAVNGNGWKASIVCRRGGSCYMAGCASTCSRVMAYCCQ